MHPALLHGFPAQVHLRGGQWTRISPTLVRLRRFTNEHLWCTQCRSLRGEGKHECNVDAVVLKIFHFASNWWFDFNVFNFFGPAMLAKNSSFSCTNTQTHSMCWHLFAFLPFFWSSFWFYRYLNRLQLLKSFSCSKRKVVNASKKYLKFHNN